MAGYKKVPRRTSRAVGDAGRRIKKGVEIRRVTIGVATVLEMIESPLANGKKPETMLEILESIFAMTHAPVDVQQLLAQGRGAYTAAALAWGDKLSIDDASAIVTACLQGIRDNCGVAGGGGAEGNVPSGATDG